MKQITIAFDIDGTILSEDAIPPGMVVYPKTEVNITMGVLLSILYDLKNIRLIAWSGGGADYAEKRMKEYRLDHFFSAFYSKLNCPEKVDIAFDDVDDFELADKNLIVGIK